MRSRDPRIAVRIQARMRIDREWVDVSIHNLSSRGLMAKTRADVTQRSYVELRRGSHIVIGRVVWCRGGAFGVRSQDRIDITGLMGAPRSESGGAGSSTAPTERRATSRDHALSPERRAERSQALARHFQFAAIAVAGLSGCATIAIMVARMLQSAVAPTLAALGG